MASKQCEWTARLLRRLNGLPNLHAGRALYLQQQKERYIKRSYFDLAQNLVHRSLPVGRLALSARGRRAAAARAWSTDLRN